MSSITATLPGSLPTASDAHRALIDAFVFEPFVRTNARSLGLELHLFAAEAAGLVKFVRCLGVDRGEPYNSDNEQFRCLC